MTCLDTDFVISLFRGEKNTVIKLRELEDSQKTLYITTASVAELLKGAYNSKQYEKEISRIMMFLESVDVLDFDIKSAHLFAKIWYDLKKSGRMIDEFDILVASTVHSNDETLLTKGIKHFEKISALKIDTW